MLRSEAIDKIIPALHVAQANLEPVLKDANNPYFKSKYADLAGVYRHTIPVLSENGLLLLQPTDLTIEGQTVVETYLMHTSGQFVGSVTPVHAIPDKDGKITPQAMGSGITYARRYGVMALLGLPADDDDGNAGSGRPQAGKQPPPAKEQGGKPPVKGTITKVQVKTISNLLTKGGWTVVSATAAYKVKTLEELSKEQGDELTKRLETGIAKQAEAAQKAAQEGAGAAS